MAGTKTANRLNGVEDQAAKSASHLAGMEKGAASPDPVMAISIPALQIGNIIVQIRGTSPLIVNRFSEKARRQMLDKQMGKASAGRAKKVPEDDYRASLYVLPDGKYGFPAIAFKHAAVTACTSTGKQVTKVAARQAFHVVGEYVVIEGEPRMREDMVRLSTGVADIRFRGEFPEWSTQLQIRYNMRTLSPEQIFNLINLAGFSVGVGEWRTEKDGSYGMFECV